jgi:hypothetical protein
VFIRADGNRVLGHFVSSSGMCIRSDKSKALQDWPEPTNVSELRSCLGTFNYLRPYIRNYSDIVSPLVALTRKYALWRWRADVEGHALQHMKLALLEAPVLISPNPDNLTLSSMMHQTMQLVLVLSRRRGKGIDVVQWHFSHIP